MQTITYRITYGDGSTEMAAVPARTINGGFTKALRIARQPLGNGREREISAVTFWQVGDITPAARARAMASLARDLPTDDDYYDAPDDTAGTVFDPADDTFGPIMAAIQAGDFGIAAGLLAALDERCS